MRLLLTLSLSPVGRGNDDCNHNEFIGQVCADVLTYFTPNAERQSRL